MIPNGLKRIARRALERLVARPARRAAHETAAPLAATVTLLGRRLERLEAEQAAARGETVRLAAALGCAEARLAEERERALRAESRLAGDSAAARSVTETLAGRIDHVEFSCFEATLSARAAAFRPPDPATPPAPRPDPVRLLSPAALDAKLATLAPAAHPLWKRTLEDSRRAYAGTPADSCSVEGNAVAAQFRRFLAPLLRGHVLDIGCGIQAKPLYLADWPDRLIAGVDPLAPAEPHPFVFAAGVAERLPWPDGVFDVAVAATSLDHVLHPARAVAECARVLKPGGHFVVWEWIVPEAAPYDPVNGPAAGVDAYHLFRFDGPSFARSCEPWFEIEESIAVPVPGSRSRFFSLRRRAAAAS